MLPISTAQIALFLAYPNNRFFEFYQEVSMFQIQSALSVSALVLSAFAVAASPVMAEEWAFDVFWIKIKSANIRLL